jgi:hypothetical protein
MQIVSGFSNFGYDEIFASFQTSKIDEIKNLNRSTKNGRNKVKRNFRYTRFLNSEFLCLIIQNNIWANFDIGLTSKGRI